MKINQKVTEYIYSAAEEQIVILEKLRMLIHQTVDNVSEDIKWGFPVFAQIKDFAYLRFAKNHITLGFYNIDKIKDPNKLLEGEGNTLKHIKIKSHNEIKEDMIKEWLMAITN